jgi:hypothetical protein
VVQLPESHQNGTPMAGASPRAADERKRQSAKLMVALKKHEEAKSGLAVETSRQQF